MPESEVGFAAELEVVGSRADEFEGGSRTAGFAADWRAAVDY